ncbi:MAG: NADH-quinone oxidoreductase subunit C [Candidatus Rokubacteria bacterium]|nr:NADH-quinone oxidoreductase subunit C [Candidatus Rokubacteria bacterium]MBI3824729.1 NADH-quinone oxidoreductase subunit C [Candidatus Rokubacteria bacterium]
MTPSAAVTALREKLGVEPALEGRVVSVDVPVERWVECARLARTELGCLYFNWLSAVDWKEQGLEVLCRLDDLDGGWALAMRTKLGPDRVHCPTLTGLYRGADWMERECWDLLGVVFDGHPDLRRILLGQDWVGHPLRKDYAVDTAYEPYR